MASNDSHAAWQNTRSFTVTLLPSEGEPTELAAGLAEFLEAVDLASEWLAREDPERAGTTGIAIFETRDDTTEKVWEYPPQDVPFGEQGLVKVFGFDPVNWRPAGREFVLERPLASPRLLPVQEPAPAAPPAPERERDDAPEPPRPQVGLGGTVAAGRRIAPLLHASWGDRVSRVCLLVAAFSLWLAITLVDVRFLALLLLATAGLWWRREGRAAAAASALEEEDLL